MIYHVVLPNYLTTLIQLSSVIESIYIPIPAAQLKISTDTAKTTSTYSVHFGGTLADLCGRVTVDSYSGNPVTCGLPLYVLDSSGNEYKVNGNDVVIDGTYLKQDGTNAVLTEIPKYLFRSLSCSKVVLADSIEYINAAAFAFCTAKNIYIGSGVKRIGSGALYSNSADRAIYYNGSINDWMKICCTVSSNTSSGEGGPFFGANNTLYVKNSSGSYVNAFSNGKLEYTLSKTNTVKEGNSSNVFEDINGQLQGLKGLTTLIIYPESNNTEYTTSDNSYYNCSNLETVTIGAKVKFGKYVFKGTALTDLYLTNSNQCTCTDSSVFDGLSGVVVHVPSNLVDTYNANSNWASMKRNGNISDFVAIE